MTGTPARPMGLLRITLVLGALEAFGPLSMDLYLPQLPQLARTLDTSDALAQTTMSVCMIGLGLGQLIAGPLSDRFGRKRPLVIGVILFALLSAVCAVSPTIEVLLGARFLQGLAGSAGVVISMAVARDLFSGVQLSRMLSLLALVTSLTPIIAPVIGGQLARVMDWRGIFLVLAGIGTVLVFVAQFGLRETLTDGRHAGSVLGTTASHISVILRDPLFVALMIAACLGGAAFFSYLSMSSFVLQDQFGLSPQLFSVVFATNALAQLGGAQLSRLFVARMGTTRMYLVGQLAGATAAVVLLGATLAGAPAIVVIVLLALFLGANGLGGPNGTTLALGGHGTRAGTASALLGMAMFTAGAVAAPVVSALAGTSAITMVSTIAVGSGAAAAVAVLVIRRLAPRNDA
ncbi:DHA1 family bicyclomycin/chloramphenicol resistance-like MFS transporter [Leucobacter luti]|uniref:multidrug effflux MFS transporter n=1 Tax=Leucobacter luti TaxID=340320 RepID=UPI0010F045AA|nr:multidrug effflux MFS transporter [Leucobacter luti]MCW2288280.1 DHA1 family bicyclomycin/chloramphenicol resistance-like MFS transporter [Leucobacter luti]TCK45562.1 DHA1 family bicyclomycin/chloramphenicol resistance-like MFS transporter [Leucobacter luti]